MKPEVEALLGGYSAGTLTKEEDLRLVQAALEDQEVFDALAAEQPFRELLSRPAVRQELIEALTRPTYRERVVGWLPVVRPSLLAAVAAAAVAAILWLRPGPEVPTPSQSASGAPISAVTPSPPRMPGFTPIVRPGEPGEHAAMRGRLFALPLRRSFSADVRLDRSGEVPKYRFGDGLRLTVSIERECNLLILEKRSDGTMVQIFPSPSSPFPRAKAGVPYSIPPAGEPAAPVSAPKGPRVVRLLAFPVGVDPESISPAQLKLIEPQLSIFETSYVVER